MMCNQVGQTSLTSIFFSSVSAEIPGLKLNFNDVGLGYVVPKEKNF